MKKKDKPKKKVQKKVQKPKKFEGSIGVAKRDIKKGEPIRVVFDKKYVSNDIDFSVEIDVLVS